MLKIKRLATTGEPAAAASFQVYTGSVLPLMENGASAWATVTKSNTSMLAKVRNNGIRITTGGLKTTPTLAIETATRLPSLGQGREEKVLIHREKIKRLCAHPVSQHLQEVTKNRLKGISFNHLAKHLAISHAVTLPATPEEREPLVDADDW